MPAVPTITLPVVLLRSAIGDAVLRPGMVLGGRVLERNGAHGLLLLRGAPVVAKLPDGVLAGARLRLEVAQADADQVVLRALPEAPATVAAPVPGPAAFAAALPGGAHVRVAVEEDGAAGAAGGGRPGTAIHLRLDSPQLGRLDLRLDAGACAVHAAAGPPADAARAAAGELREALAAVTGRPVQVTVHPRTSALDVSA